VRYIVTGLGYADFCAGDLEAQLALSGWYLTGSDGVIQQSDTEAYLWARKAAEKGLAKAEYALGYFTEVGIGVPANLDDAKRWYYKAASMFPAKFPFRWCACVLTNPRRSTTPKGPIEANRVKEGRNGRAKVERKVVPVEREEQGRRRLRNYVK
jgi:hypothetical protein